MSKWLLALVLIQLYTPPGHAQSNPLWHVQKVKNFLPHMTWPEVDALLTRTDMVIIPVPAIEQHGLISRSERTISLVRNWRS